MLQIKHKDCGGNLYINIDIKNVYGKPNIRIKEKHKILVSFASLLAFNVQITSKGLRCDKCEEILEDSETLQLVCGFSGNKGLVKDFKLIYAHKADTKEDLQPQLLHNKVKDQYIEDVRNDGFTVTEIQPKIYLDEEIKHG
jgi:hypothetical protein